MITTAAGVLAASLVGSVHCAGMCGGFVCFYAGSSSGGEPAALRAHVMYNVGRLVSYLTLGALAGVIGAGVAQAGTLVGISRAAAVVAGALMVAWALSTIAAQRGFTFGGVQAPVAWQRALGRVLHGVRTQPMAVRAGLTGLLTTLLPCGWLYVFVAAAGGTGGVRSAMLTMAVFWLGTLPALLAVGVGAQRVLAPFRRRLPALSATVVLIMGLLSMSGHLGGVAQPHAEHGATALAPVNNASAPAAPPAPATGESAHEH
ncbi:MAG: sulfite exporter TauE/SafE family protein [Gemmatimonas sp.]|uniref:sulfite exporter TauE/SafE family protein n=2 Tax=Gemmatimonas sp. TaxID=1962908 RepID=UPI00391F4DE2